MKTWLRIIALTALCGTANTAMSGPMPIAGDVATMDRDSNVVVFGRVVRQKALGMLQDSVQVEVDRVLRGEESLVGSVLELKFNPELTDFSVGEQGYGIFFLRCARAKACRAAFPGYPALEVPGGALPPPTPGATVEAQVRQMLVHVALSPSAELERDLPPGKKTPAGRERIYAQYVRVNAIQALDTLAQGPSPQPLLDAMQSNDADIRIAAAALLAQAGNYTHLREVDALVVSDDGDREPIIVALARAVQTSSGNPEAPISSMIVWLDARNDFVRSVASSVLRDSKSEAAIAGLRNALDDASQLVRYDAAVGILDITGAPDIPQYSAFAADEARYIAEARVRWFEQPQACGPGGAEDGCPPHITELRVYADPKPKPKPDP